MEEYDVDVMSQMVSQNRKNVGLPPQNGLRAGRTSLSFERVVDHGRIAFKGYMAIWNKNETEHIVIGAPDLEALSVAWLGIVGVPLDRTLSQEVFIVSAKSTTDRG